jgi:hypothetical protein
MKDVVSQKQTPSPWQTLSSRLFVPTLTDRRHYLLEQLQ